MRISDWSSDVCSSDLPRLPCASPHHQRRAESEHRNAHPRSDQRIEIILLQSSVMRLMMVAVPCPSEAMHDVLVAGPRHQFHCGDGGNDDGEGGNSGHGSTVTLVLLTRDKPLQLLTVLRLEIGRASGWEGVSH